MLFHNRQRLLDGFHVLLPVFRLALQIVQPDHLKLLAQFEQLLEGLLFLISDLPVEILRKLLQSILDLGDLDEASHVQRLFDVFFDVAVVSVEEQFGRVGRLDVGDLLPELLDLILEVSPQLVGDHLVVLLAPLDDVCHREQIVFALLEDADQLLLHPASLTVFLRLHLVHIAFEFSPDLDLALFHLFHHLLIVSLDLVVEPLLEIQTEGVFHRVDSLVGRVVVFLRNGVIFDGDESGLFDFQINHPPQVFLRVKQILLRLD